VRWLPFVAVIILLTVFFLLGRATFKRTGHPLVRSIPLVMIFMFVTWFLLFSSLGFAEGRGMRGVFTSSADTGIGMTCLVGWQMSCQKIKAEGRQVHVGLRIAFYGAFLVGFVVLIVGRSVGERWLHDLGFIIWGMTIPILVWQALLDRRNSRREMAKDDLKI